MSEEFCCEEMQYNLDYTSALKRITEWGLDKDISEFSDCVKSDIKIGQIWLMDSEYVELEASPFKFCPWCGKELSV